MPAPGVERSSPLDLDMPASKPKEAPRPPKPSPQAVAENSGLASLPAVLAAGMVTVGTPAKKKSNLTFELSADELDSLRNSSRPAPPVPPPVPELPPAREPLPDLPGIEDDLFTPEGIGFNDAPAPIPPGPVPPAAPPVARPAPPPPPAYAPPPVAPVIEMPDRAPPLLMDVTPHSLGIETAGGYCLPLIRKGAPIPSEQNREFSTGQDGQETVAVRICQGEERGFELNQALGEIELTGLRNAPRGQVKIDVIFIIDASGTLAVRATDSDTGRAQEIRVNLLGGASEEDIASMRDRQQRLFDA